MIVTNRGTVMKIECVYPEENPEGTVQDITCALAALGVFEGLRMDEDQGF